jgi:LEA14-like dessication related protein
VRNPNAFALSARAVDYRLRIGGHVLAAGRSSSRVTVPAQASSTVDVRMEVSFPAIGAAAPDALMLGEIPYDLDGTLRVGSCLATREVPFAAASVLAISPPLEMAGGPRLPPALATGTARAIAEAHRRAWSHT